MRDLLPIICSGQASKGGRIQLIHGSSQGGYDPGHPTVGGRPPPDGQPDSNHIRANRSCKGNRAERDGSERSARQHASLPYGEQLANWKSYRRTTEPSRSARSPLICRLRRHLLPQGEKGFPICSPPHAAASPRSLRRIAAMMRAVAANIGSRFAFTAPSALAASRTDSASGGSAPLSTSPRISASAPPTDAAPRAAVRASTMERNERASNGGASSGKPPAARVLAIRSARSEIGRAHV